MLAGRVPFTGESPTVIMMKQVQDAPPSIREARPQLPAAIETVIDRALAKRPADRFASAGELSHALANAATGSTETAVMTAAPVTVPNAPVALPADDDEVTVVRPASVKPVAVDEVTVVRPRRTEVPLPPPPAEPPALAGMNPWRIMIPGLIALVAVFGLVFFLTRGTTQTPPDNSNVAPTGLLQDPNGQPVQPAGTPTGDTERDIHSQPSMSPTPRSASANANVGQEIPSTTVIGNFGSNENSNQANSNRTANKRESPTPKASPVEEMPPPPKPKPSATIRSVPKPVASPTGNP
jgi:serine/threonine-protein kinase